jgi:hypothetical protein
MGVRRLKPKLSVPTGIAIGLVVVWTLAPYLMPELAEDPLARGFFAVGLAGVGAVVAYVVMVLVTRTWPGAGRD